MHFDGPGKGEATGKIFLYDTRSRPGVTGRYMCLSYCWGGHLRLRTLKVNLPDMEKNIPWSILPKTFQDAVRLTKVLGISYLWIDALCIVQDDPADWDEEASRMSTIYSDSYLTVAASYAESSDSGFYTLLEADTEQELHLSGAKGTVFVRPARHSTLIDMSDDMHRTPLTERAWPLQEYLLPCRVLQFGPREMIWECNTDVFCECRTTFATEADPIIDVGRGIRKLEWQAAKRSSSRLSKIHSYNTTFNTASESIPPFVEPATSDAKILKYLWFRIVTNYTLRSLTYQEDKLTALSGIATVITKITGWEYYAGMWRHSIIKALQWRSYDFQHPRPAMYTAPTWSWASATKNVDFFDWQYEVPRAEVLEIACTPAGVDRCGRVSDAYIVIRGPVLKVTEILDRDTADDNNVAHFSEFPCLCWQGQTIYYNRDYLRDPSSPSQPFICLILSTGRDIMVRNDSALSMLVLRHSRAGEVFERVGYYHRDAIQGLDVDQTEKRTLRII